MIEKMAFNKINFLSPSDAPSTASPSGTELGSQFSTMLTNALSKIETQEKTVNELTNKFATGELTDIHKLMIASQEAMIGLDLTVQIRNKVIEAYQEIMRTQV